MVKNPLASAGDTRDKGLIPGLRRSPGRGHGNPLQYPCLENPMDREACGASVHRVAESWMGLKRFSTHSYPKYCMRHTYTIQLFTVHVKFHFNWPFCILSSNPTDQVNLYFVCHFFFNHL